MQALWGNSLWITRPTVHAPWNIKGCVTFCPQVSLAGREAKAEEIEESCRVRGRKNNSLYMLMRCGFGGFNESICSFLLATCRQLVTACQSWRRSALLSLLTCRERVGEEGETSEEAQLKPPTTTICFSCDLFFTLFWIDHWSKSSHFIKTN